MDVIMSEWCSRTNCVSFSLPHCNYFSAFSHFFSFICMLPLYKTPLFTSCSEGWHQAPGPGCGDSIHVLSWASRCLVPNGHSPALHRDREVVCAAAREHHLHFSAAWTLPSWWDPGRLPHRSVLRAGVPFSLSCSGGRVETWAAHWCATQRQGSLVLLVSIVGSSQGVSEAAWGHYPC